MTDRPIIFSAPMVRALLDGRKAQTRRIIKEWRYGDPRLRYLPGDRLYVREAHALRDANPRCDLAMSQSWAGVPVFYRATDDDEFTIPPRWRPSIHMPRWASRLTLTVTDVWVQRLQEISAIDVQAEGACELAFVPPTEADEAEARAIFRDLWNSLHGPDAWDQNPWIAAISFAVKRGNIDA